MSYHSLPEAARLDPIRAGTTDLRGVDVSGDLIPLQDRIQSITSITVIARDDGVALAEGDLDVLPSPSPYIDEAGYIVGWWLTSTETPFSNGVTVDYRIRCEVMTQQARTLVFDAMIMLMPVRG